MNVGDKCRARKVVIGGADDYSPAYLCCEIGDVLEVRKLGSQFWDYYVAHPEREAGAMFGVDAQEIEPLK